MSKPQDVYSSDGRRGVIISEVGAPSVGGRVLTVRFEGGDLLSVPADLLTPRPEGGYILPLAYAELRQGAASASPTAGEARTGEPATLAGGGRLVIPVLAEELEVERHKLTSGVVRVQKLVREHEQTVEEPVRREELHVERVPIGRIVDQLPKTRTEGETLVIPVLEEVLVVEKRVMLKEEVRVTMRRSEEPSQQRVTLRAEEVIVERVPPDTTEDRGG
jgi:uncharacterized protein (TIGR02271 family)